MSPIKWPIGKRVCFGTVTGALASALFLAITEAGRHFAPLYGGGTRLWGISALLGGALGAAAGIVLPYAYRSRALAAFVGLVLGAIAGAALALFKPESLTSDLPPFSFVGAMVGAVAGAILQESTARD